MNRYCGEYVRSKPCDSKAEAWNEWLLKFAHIVRSYPSSASLGWRAVPECFEDNDFSSSKKQYVAYARLAIDLEGEPISLPKPYEEGIVYGFGTEEKQE